MNNFRQLMFLLLVALATTKMIIPDPTNPFHQDINTSKIKDNTVTLKFSLPPGQTLHKDNMLAVDFSKTGTALSSLANTMFTCSLTDSRETVYAVEGANYSTISNRTYCKYVEHSKGKVIDSSLRLILKVTFNIDVQINNWHQIGLLLVSSTDSNYQMILASNAFLAFPYSYVPFDSLSSNPMTLKGSTVKVSGGSNTSTDDSAGLTIFVGDIFATEHSFSVNRFISKDSQIVVRFDETYISAFNTATSIKKNDTDVVLNGLFNKSVLGTGELALTGLGQDIHKGTNFTLKFTGWTAKYKTIASSKLEFLVFYKNSKSVLSYASDNSTISIKKYAISSSSVHEAEKYPYLASGMAWPLKFTIKYPLTMPSVHTLIEFEHQTNQILGFNAASCTFLNLTGEAKFGETPICFPHHSDTKNGFHFKMSAPPKDSTVELTVWVEFNKCQSEQNIEAQTDTFDFSVKMYPSISNTAALPVDTEIVADATLTSEFKCLQAAQGSSTGQRYSDYTLSDTVFILYAREINNLELVKVNSLFTKPEFNYNINVTGGSCDTVPGRIDHADANNIQVKTTTDRVYLHDNTSYADTDYLFVLGHLAEASKINEKIPSDRTIQATPFYTNSVDFVLEFGFQQKWYNQGKYNSSGSIASDTLSNLCFVQWDVSALAATVQADLEWDVTVAAVGDCITDIIAYQNALDGSTAPTTATDLVINFLYQGTNTNIDSVLLPPQTSTTVDYYFIKSKTKVNATKHRFSFPGKLPLSTADFTMFYIFTTCLSLKTDISTFKTGVFEYFEVTAMVKHSLKDNKPVRLVRMLTFLSMGDVFSSKANQIDFASNSKIYPANANLSYGYQGVCLTSLDKILSDSKQTASNTLVVFLTHVKLFESDFSKTDNSYPIPHLDTGVKAYGFSTDLTLHLSSFKVEQEEFKNGNYFGTANNVKLNISDYYTAASQVWFTSVTSLVAKASNASTKILIPHYCNEGFSSKDNFPAVTYTWFTATNYQTLKFSQGPQNGTNLVSKLTDSTLAIQKKTAFADFHLQLKPYIGASNIVVDASKSIKIGSYSEVKNFSVAVLLNSLFTLQSNATLTNFQTDGNGGFASVPFYFMKLPFGHIMLSETDSTNLAYNSGVVPVTGETLNVQNVTRPDLSKFLDQGMLYLQNKLIVSATGYSNLNANETIMSTNAEVNTKVAQYLADLENVTTSWTISYANLDNFYYDKYNRVEITAANVASAPGMNFSIELNTSKFASSAICGLKSDGTDYVQNCVTSTSATSKVFTCKSPFTQTATRNISICCFNLSFDTPTAFSIEKMNAGYTKSTEVASTNWTLAYTTNNNTPSETISGITIQATEAPKIVSFTFNQATTIGGVGYVVIQVSLTRQLGPNMLIEVSGQLSELSVFNEIPNCIATTASTGNYGNYIFGDEIIDECRVKQFSTANALVEVTTKNSIFSCLSKYSETLYIKLGPVRVVDVTKYDYTARLSIDNAGVGLGTPSKPTSNLTTPVDDVIVADTGDSQPVLCNPETIFPMVVGAKADITFNINMGGFLEKLDTFRKRPNEISFYFPTRVFGFLPETLECSTSLANIEPDCQVNENNILNVGLKSFVVAKTSSFFLTISGFPVPRMNSEEFNYICSLNNVSFDGNREVLVIGKGQRGGEISNESAFNSRLVFFNLENKAYESRNYRGVLEFAFTVDRASNHAFEGKELTNTPSVVFEFPSNYPLKGADVSVEVKQIKEDTSSSTFSLLPEEVIAFKTVQPVGHIISANLNLTSGKFQVAGNIHYYKVKMVNLPFPTEALVESGALQVYFVDSNDSAIFRTYLNTNNQFNNAVIEGTQNGLINMYRGFTFNFPSDKLKVDLTKENNESKLDIVAGFYSPFKYTIKNFATNVGKEEELSLRFSMTPTNLRLRGDSMNDSNLIVFSGSDITSFEMAVSCKTQVGQYFLEIEANAQSATSRMLFVKRHPVEVKYEKKVIDCSIPPNIPKSSRVKFTCVVPETFDSVNFTFTNSNSSDSYSLGSITCHLNGQLAVCEFMTAFNKNLVETNSLKFQATTGNDCLKFGSGGDSQELTFNLIAPVDQGIAEDDLKLVEFKTVAQESNLKYDEIMVSVDAPQYSEIACVMSCPSETLPEALELLAFSKHVDSDKQKWRYIYSANSETKFLTFNGLQRAVNYKLMCAISSINSEGTRIFYSKEADTLKNGEETSAQIRLSESNTTRCLDFTFSRKIEDKVERGLVSYCNNLYGPGNGIKTGCIVCTDYQKKYLSKGYKVDKPECALQPKLRRLQESTNTTESTNTGTTTESSNTTENTEVQQQEAQFTVCAVQDLFCSTQLEENTNAQLFNSFSSAVDSKEKMIKSLGIPENSLQDFTLKQVLKVEDGVAPNMTLCSENNITVDCVKVVKQDFKILGDYHVQLQFGGDYQCLYKVKQTDDTLQTLENMRQCKSDEMCGNFLTSIIAVSDLQNKPNPFRLVHNKEYELLLACFQKKVLLSKYENTNVLRLSKFTVSRPEKNCPRPDLDIDPYKEGKCYCEDSNKRVVEQGIDARDCLSAFLTLSLSVFLLFVIA